MLRMKFLCGFILLLLHSAAYAQTYKNNVSVRWGLSSEIMMDFKLDYHYIFSKYVGIGGGIFLNSEFGQVKMPHGNFINCKNELDILDVKTGQKLDYVICPNKGDGFFGSYPMIYDNKLYLIGNNTLYRYPTYPWK